jgi:ABC-type Na+ transport system ATPase subunit NatA
MCPAPVTAKLDYVIELVGLTKKFAQHVAVDDLSVTLASGRVTALLGPNGAGKSTMIRMVLGLDHPTAGTARIDGNAYGDLRYPLRSVGAHLDARAFHPRRSARANLLALARYNGLPTARVDQVLAEVGLAEVARRRAGTFSLGMGQRLGIASGRDVAADILPAQQAHIRLHPHAGCDYYTNGNYPLAYGNFEVCFRDGRITSLVDRTRG